VKKILLIIIPLLVVSCSSHIRFIQTDENYVPYEKSDTANIVFTPNKVQRPHQPIGIIEIILDKHARKLEITQMMIKKAREIGADGVMMVKYDIDKEVYFDHYKDVVGRGPWKRHVVRTKRRVKVNKIATGVAVVFK